MSENYLLLVYFSYLFFKILYFNKYLETLLIKIRRYPIMIMEQKLPTLSLYSF